MPNTFTDEDLEKKKIELENKLKRLENDKLDEISDNDDYSNPDTESLKGNDEVIVKVNDTNIDDDDEEYMNVLRNEINNLNENLSDTKKDESDESDNEDELEKKVCKIIDKRKQLKVYKEDIDNLISNVEIYMEKIMDNLDNKNTITKKDSIMIEKEFQSIMDEFDAEYENIIGDMPKNLLLPKTYINSINKRISKVEYDVNKYI